MKKLAPGLVPKVQHNGFAFPHMSRFLVTGSNLRPCMGWNKWYPRSFFWRGPVLCCYSALECCFRWAYQHKRRSEGPEEAGRWNGQHNKVQPWSTNHSSSAVSWCWANTPRLQLAPRQQRLKHIVFEPQEITTQPCCPVSTSALHSQHVHLQDRVHAGSGLH